MNLMKKTTLAIISTILFMFISCGESNNQSISITWKDKFPSLWSKAYAESAEPKPEDVSYEEFIQAVVQRLKADSEFVEVSKGDKGEPGISNANFIVKRNNEEIGKLIDIGSSSVTFSTPTGYVVDVSNGSGSYKINDVTLHYESDDCSGEAYIRSIHTKRVLFNTHKNSIYYIDADAEPVSLSFNSIGGFSGCSQTSFTSVGFPVIANDVLITGVPDGGYTGPFSIESE